MRVFIVHAYGEPQSFNGAMTRAAVEGLEGAGHEVQVRDTDWQFEMAVTLSIDAPYIELGQCAHARGAHTCATVPQREPGADG